jgi:charged multivesicular body protein 5
MNRLFGSSAPKAAKPTLDGSVKSLQERVATHEVRIAAINAELEEVRTRINKLQPGSQAQKLVKKKALIILQRKRGQEKQRDNLIMQMDNLESVQMSVDNAKNTMTMVDTIKSTTKALKKEYGKLDIDKIERMQDEMADLLDVGNDIQESLARSYDIPEDVDEAELDAELEALGQEAEYEREMAGMDSTALGFLQDEVPEFIDEAPGVSGQVKEVAR